MANIPLKSIKFPGLDDTYTVPQVDDDLDTAGAAADAKATGDALTEINERLVKTLEIKESTATDPDLDVSDPQGNVILRLQDGYIYTKNFDGEQVIEDISNLGTSVSGKLASNQGSVNAGKILGIDNSGNVVPEDAPESGGDDITVRISDANHSGLDISDRFGNVIVRFKDGQVATKYFNSLRYADVKAFGAVGDGITDDTDALELAMAYGYENNVPVRFSSGTYLIRRPLTLRSNMEIYGEGGAKIKTKASATTVLTETCEEGDETITVQSTSGFEVGDPIAISMDDTGNAAARHCSVGYITALTSTTITFKSAYDSIKTGAVKEHEVGSYVSNACAIFRSWGMLYPCDNTYIHNLTLDGNRQNAEWADWFAGCIHIDAQSDTVEGITWKYSQKNNTFRDLTLLNSHFDGISDQGNGGGTVENCKIDNPYWHGVHFGTTYSLANVVNNEIRNAVNGAGVFWCAGAKDIVVEGNRIINCHKGCSDYEYGTAGNKSIVNGNIFIGTESYVFDFALGSEADQGTIVITDNVIEAPEGTIARFRNRKRVIFSSNIIETIPTGISNVFDCTGSDGLTFIGNITGATSATIIGGSPTNLVNALNSWN